MKAHRYITAILTVLFIGFSTLNGQASARTQSRDKKESPTVRKTQARHTQTTVKRTPAKQTQARHTQTTVKRTPAKQTQARQVQANRGPSVSRYGQTATRTNTVYNRPVGMSTKHNPRSMKEHKYSSKRYYGGNHYHNVYPAHKVRTHYHYDTHVHHYNVLYYPSFREIYWTRSMYRDYHRWYPNYRWNYNYGYRIHSISIFDAKYNLGEVANVYGRVYSTWYNRETDDYLLFFGGDFGSQQFTLVLPGPIARKFSRKPSRYFLGQHLTVTGLITTFDGIPEIVVKNRTQVMIY